MGNCVRCAVSIVFTAMLAGSLHLQAQQPANDSKEKSVGKLSFAVASVRPGELGVWVPPSFYLDYSDAYPEEPGPVFKVGMTAADYIEFAYHLWFIGTQRQNMLANQPKWVGDQNFVIDARAPMATPTKQEMRLMLQSLLAERFHLQIHFEKREVTALALTLAKSGALGPGLRAHVDGPACGTPAKIFPPRCHTFPIGITPNHTLRLGTRDATMDQIAVFLSSQSRLDLPMVDQTGLDGKFDLLIEFVPEHTGPNPPPPVQEGPTFVQALRDQVGLQLKQTKVTIDVPVIDHIELPSAN